MPFLSKESFVDGVDWYEDDNPPATGATAGIPGSWTPAGSLAPSGPGAPMAGITANPSTPWTAGQFMQTRTAGAEGRVTWSGTDWVGGVAPGGAYDPGAYTVDEVKVYVEEHPDEATDIYDAEVAGKNRVTLVEWLETFIAGPA